VADQVLLGRQRLEGGQGQAQAPVAVPDKGVQEEVPEGQEQEVSEAPETTRSSWQE
jgi:hypothetical protein